MATGTLTGQTIANTYKSLLKITGTTAGGETLHATTQKVIEDGDGNPFPLSAAADALMITSTNRLEFGDDASYIHQSADGVLDLVSDTEIELNATTIDINGAVDISGNTVISAADEQALTVRTGDSGRVGIVLQNSDTGSDTDFTDGLVIKLDSDETGQIGMAENKALNFMTNGANRITIANNGPITMAENVSIDAGRTLTTKGDVTLKDESGAESRFLFDVGGSGDNPKFIVYNNDGSTQDFKIDNGTITSVSGATFNGSVGINTSPSYQLDVGGSVTGDFIARIRNEATSGNPQGLLVRIDDADSTNALFGLNNSGTYHMYMKGDGRTGFGTTSPATGAKLHVKGNGGGQAIAVFEDDTVNANVLIKASDANRNSILNFGDAASNEIGQIDYDHNDNSMRFQVNSATAIKIKSNGSVVANPGGSGNTVFGEDSGIALTSVSDHNTFFGYQTGMNLTGSSGGGDKNVFVGFGAGLSATKTINSVAIGSGALDAVTTGGHYNIAIGTNVLTSLTTGEENIAIGDSVGLNMTVTSDCVLIGSGAGVNINASNTDADGTVAIGQQALNALTDGNKNLAVGFQALHDVAGGDGNMGIGYQSAASIGRGEADNIAIGNRAMLSLMENASSSDVDSNIAIGVDAMTGGEIGSGASFVKNIAIGNNALNSTGSHGNTGLLAIGHDALTSNTTAAGNTAIGYLSGQNTTTGGENVFLGYNAGQSNVGGSRGTFVGYQAGVSSNVTGSSDNTLIGRTAGQSITSGTGNTFVGSNCDGSNTTNSNVFGGSVVGTAGTFTFGEGTNITRATNGGTTWSAPSDKRLKRNIEDSELGLSFINDLKPRTYNWALKGDLPEYHSDYVKDSTEQWRSDKKVHGFIAQEVKESIDKSGDSVADGFEGWQINEHNDLQMISESAFIPALVKAVQELSAKVTELESKLGE